MLLTRISWLWETFTIIISSGGVEGKTPGSLPLRLVINLSWFSSMFQLIVSYVIQGRLRKNMMFSKLIIVTLHTKMDPKRLQTGCSPHIIRSSMPCYCSAIEQMQPIPIPCGSMLRLSSCYYPSLPHKRTNPRHSFCLHKQYGPEEES